ncbi:Uncharacterised protein [Mycobacteroides abscessus subsp. abscessus]|nr:Uncharacterised protein [Mycobacteroides abscessus subsp. abscessus]
MPDITAMPAVRPPAARTNWVSCTAVISASGAYGRSSRIRVWAPSAVSTPADPALTREISLRFSREKMSAKTAFACSSVTDCRLALPASASPITLPPATATARVLDPPMSIPTVTPSFTSRATCPRFPRNA